MNTRRLQYVQILSLAVALATLEGCEHFRHTLREKDPDVVRSTLETKDEKAKDEPETSKVLDVQSDPKKPTPFFKGSRLSGAMSPEGREVERSLGIPL